MAHVPPAATPEAVARPFSMLVAMAERDPFVGKIVTGRVASGTVAVGDALRVLHHGGELRSKAKHSIA